MTHSREHAIDLAIIVFYAHLLRITSLVRGVQRTVYKADGGKWAFWLLTRIAM